MVGAVREMGLVERRNARFEATGWVNVNLARLSLIGAEAIAGDYPETEVEVISDGVEQYLRRLRSLLNTGIRAEDSFDFIRATRLACYVPYVRALAAVLEAAKSDDLEADVVFEVRSGLIAIERIVSKVKSNG